MPHDIHRATTKDIDCMLNTDEKVFAEFVTTVDGKFDPEQWRKYIAGDIPRAFVLFVDGQYGGYFRYSELEDSKGKYAYLRVISVEDEHKGKGYGKALYDVFLQAIKKAGFTRIILSCPKGFASNSWYLKLGYTLFESDEHANRYVLDEIIK